MIAYQINFIIIIYLLFIWLKFKNQNSLILNYMNLTNLSQVTKLHYVYIFILLGTTYVFIQDVL